MVGVMQSSPTGSIFSVAGGRTDLFTISGTNLVVQNATTAWTGVEAGDAAFLRVSR